MYEITFNDSVLESFNTREEAEARMDVILADPDRERGMYGIKLPITPEAQTMIDTFEANKVREDRDSRLTTEVDPLVTNPLRWDALDEATQQAWKDYRQALLDVPSQAGFPHDITWPEKP